MRAFLVRNYVNNSSGFSVLMKCKISSDAHLHTMVFSVNKFFALENAKERRKSKRLGCFKERHKFSLRIHWSYLFQLYFQAVSGGRSMRRQGHTETKSLARFLSRRCEGVYE